MVNDRRQTITVSKATLKWILALAIGFLTTVTGFAWRASATLSDINSRLAGVEGGQAETKAQTKALAIAVGEVQSDVQFIRGGLQGPLRTGLAAGSSD